MNKRSGDVNLGGYSYLKFVQGNTMMPQFYIKRLDMGLGYKEEIECSSPSIHFGLITMKSK